MPRRKLSALVGAFVLTLGGGGVAHAAIHDYVLTAPNQSGTLLGTPFANETVIYTVRADTATLTAYPSIALFPVAGPGKCVTGTAATVQVGAGAPIAITEPTLFCSADAGGLAGIYFVDQNGPNHHVDTGILDLTTPGAVGPGVNHNLSTFYAVAITGGAFTDSTDGSSGNTTTAQVIAVAAPATVPTLTEWAMMLMGLVLAGGAAVIIQRRSSLA